MSTIAHSSATVFHPAQRAQPDIEVVGEPINGQEAVARVAELGPDVVLMEVRMRVMDGLQATRAITAGATAGRGCWC